MNGADLRALVASVPVADLPDLVAELGAATVMAWLRLLGNVPGNEPGNALGDGGLQAPDSSKNALRNESAGQISAALGVPESAVYDWARKRRIPSERYGRFVRFNLDEVRAALNPKRADNGTRKKARQSGRLSGAPTTRLPVEGAQ